MDIVPRILGMKQLLPILCHKDQQVHYSWLTRSGAVRCGGCTERLSEEDCSAMMDAYVAPGESGYGPVGVS